jgi:hypothetical protein
MKKSTTITYNIETCDGTSRSELEYKDYDKDEKGIENILHYKAMNVRNEASIKAISDRNEADCKADDETSELKESFNRICKVDDRIDETIGVSSNNNDWNIREYKNHKLDKKYIQEYDTIQFNIKRDLLVSSETIGVSKDLELASL